eukprot:1146862-Pelagomonas_calceolata.AAC.1
MIIQKEVKACITPLCSYKGSYEALTKALTKQGNAATADCTKCQGILGKDASLTVRHLSNMHASTHNNCPGHASKGTPPLEG